MNREYDDIRQFMYSQPNQADHSKSCIIMYLVYYDGCWSQYADVWVENVQLTHLSIVGLNIFATSRQTRIFLSYMQLLQISALKCVIHLSYWRLSEMCMECICNMSTFYNHIFLQFRNKCQGASLSKSLVTYSFGRTTLYFLYIDKYNAESIFYNTC